jgi:hypothetical protein
MENAIFAYIVMGIVLIGYIELIGCFRPNAKILGRIFVGLIWPWALYRFFVNPRDKE